MMPQLETVLNDMDAKSAIKAGARILMSPAIVKVLNAHNAGAQVVKVYPVSVLGGVQYITALKKSFSHIPMVASQGIMLDSIGAYIHGGASTVLLSDAIFEKDAMRKRNYDRIHELACRGKDYKAKKSNARSKMMFPHHCLVVKIRFWGPSSLQEESDDNTLTWKGFSLQIHGGIEND
ncbi:hypothetical protein IFM89_015425 [Coptis chinensis]|uniref:Uncharacterized protein n=1 Tax=Coptis chinensis TaxID=261450 RepID=A0A835IVI0_9MAGN|nr:hypothetical protein IFM89_015425 [Coptis chinensis]